MTRIENLIYYTIITTSFSYFTNECSLLVEHEINNMVFLETFSQDLKTKITCESYETYFCSNLFKKYVFLVGNLQPLKKSSN